VEGTELLKPIVMKCGGRESIRNLQDTEGKRENITHQNQIVPQIPTLNLHQVNLHQVIVTLTQMCPRHLTQVHLVMTGGGKERDLGKINVDIEKGEINVEKSGEGNKIRDQNVNQGIKYD
jgi:hypothetical protein